MLALPEELARVDALLAGPMRFFAPFVAYFDPTFGDSPNLTGQRGRGTLT